MPEDTLGNTSDGEVVRMNRPYVWVLVTMLLSACSGFAELRDPSLVEVREQVILVHGYGRSARAMQTMKQRFHARGYSVHTLDYSTLTRSIEEVQKEVSNEIDQVLHDHPYKTHFVGHSLGGLLVRDYLGQNRVRHRRRIGLCYRCDILQADSHDSECCSNVV